MNGNSIAIRIHKRDYFNLPEHCRKQDDLGPLVLTKIRGRDEFVPALILE